MARGVKPQIANLEHHAALDRAAAAERPHARQQLGQRERLDQVVIGAAIQSPNAIFDGVAGGQHQHRRLDPLFAQRPTHLEAIDVGQHHIEHDHVIVGGAGPHQRVAPAVHGVGRDRVGGQPATQHRAQLDVVLYHQCAHSSTDSRVKMRAT